MVKSLQEKINWKKIIKMLVSGLIIIIVYFLAKEMISNADSITKLAQSAGIFGPLVLILLICLGILFTPIPSFVLIITAGYLYGTWQGAIYSYIGHLLAASGTFATVKIFRRKNKNKTYEKYKTIIKKNKNMLYLLYGIPILPVSLTSIISASIKMTWKEFLKIILISFIIPVLFFSYFGNILNKTNTIEIIAFLVIIIVGAIIMIRMLKKKEEKTNKKEEKD